MQDIWKTKLDCDASVDETIVKRLQGWLQGLFDLSKLKIPRWKGLSSKVKIFQLHIFCNASEEGCCPCVYCLVKTNSETITTLLTTKLRVSPLKS
jgi:hypothetical protein